MLYFRFEMQVKLLKLHNFDIMASVELKRTINFIICKYGAAAVMGGRESVRGTAAGSAGLTQRAGCAGGF